MLGCRLDQMRTPPGWDCKKVGDRALYRLLLESGDPKEAQGIYPAVHKYFEGGIVKRVEVVDGALTCTCTGHASTDGDDGRARHAGSAVCKSLSGRILHPQGRPRGPV